MHTEGEAPRSATSTLESAPGGASPVRPRRGDVVASYDLGVEAYETRWSAVILPGATALLRELAVADGDTVLDVGAGTGAVAELIRDQVPGAAVLAVDASSQMLGVAHRQRGFPAVQADAMALPVAEGAADAVVLAYVLFHLADPSAAIREAARALRPGGCVGTVTWVSERNERAQDVWAEALADAGVPTLPARRVDTGLDSAPGVERLLADEGLVPVRSWIVTLRHQWDREAFWALATGSGVNRRRLAQIDPEARAALLVRSRALLDELAPEDFAWSGEVLCAVAAKPDDSVREVA
jgi:SAM-dependent methyltransferase